MRILATLCSYAKAGPTMAFARQDGPLHGRWRSAMNEAYPPDEPDIEPCPDLCPITGAGPENELLRLESVRRPRERQVAEMRRIPVQAPASDLEIGTGDSA